MQKNKKEFKPDILKEELRSLEPVRKNTRKRLTLFLLMVSVFIGGLLALFPEQMSAFFSEGGEGWIDRRLVTGIIFISLLVFVYSSFIKSNYRKQYHDKVVSKITKWIGPNLQYKEEGAVSESLIRQSNLFDFQKIIQDGGIQGIINNKQYKLGSVTLLGEIGYLVYEGIFTVVELDKTDIPGFYMKPNLIGKMFGGQGNIIERVGFFIRKHEKYWFGGFLYILSLAPFVGIFVMDPSVLASEYVFVPLIPTILLLIVSTVILRRRYREKAKPPEQQKTGKHYEVTYTFDDTVLKTPSEEFNRSFTVITSQPEQLRSVLSRSFYEKILSFKQKTGYPPSLSLQNSKLFIAIPVSNLFEPAARKDGVMSSAEILNSIVQFAGELQESITKH